MVAKIAITSFVYSIHANYLGNTLEAKKCNTFSEYSVVCDHAVTPSSCLKITPMQKVKTFKKSASEKLHREC